MKLLMSLYQDSEGNLWEIEKVTLPTKKGGIQTYWIAESKSANKSYKEPLKREIIKKIKKNKP